MWCHSDARHVRYSLATEQPPGQRRAAMNGALSVETVHTAASAGFRVSAETSEKSDLRTVTQTRRQAPGRRRKEQWGGAENGKPRGKGFSGVPLGAAGFKRPAQAPNSTLSTKTAAIRHAHMQRHAETHHRLRQRVQAKIGLITLNTIHP